jgi:hypothetical protein
VTLAGCLVFSMPARMFVLTRSCEPPLRRVSAGVEHDSELLISSGDTTRFVFMVVWMANEVPAQSWPHSLDFNGLPLLAQQVARNGMLRPMQPDRETCDGRGALP